MKKLVILSIFIFAILSIPTLAMAVDVTLEWDACIESNFAGYRVHYKTITSGPPYNNTVDVGNVTTFTFYDLPQGVTYYFVVTSYDISDLDSGFSNEVRTGAPTQPRDLRIVLLIFKPVWRLV